MSQNFTKPPPTCQFYTIAFPAKHVMLVTINRERAMNSIPTSGHPEGQALWAWYDSEPDLRCAIITGKGPKAFCAGADLIEQGKLRATGGPKLAMPTGGFMGMSRRTGKKPIIAAVNGFALGGGFEIALNCDMVVASPTATFGLPEASRGLYAAAGGMARVVRNFGMQLGSEIALAGRVLGAAEASQRNFCRVAKSPESLIDETLALAAQVGSLSPDAVIVTRAGLREAWETGSVERAAQLTDERFARGLFEGENIAIGLEAFAKKGKPSWVPSKL
nr:hypothetical protein B0A51_02303 [Rachicladosporium sp. CCFEE 5018]